MSQDHYERTRSMFDTSAVERGGYFDSVPGGPQGHTRWQLRVRRILLGMLDRVMEGDPELASLADLGCGNGDLTRELAKRYPQLRDVVGADFSPECVELAAREAADLANVSFRQADLRELPFETDRFDVALCLGSLHHVRTEHHPKAFAELARVARRRLVIEIKNERNLYYGRLHRETQDGLQVFPTSAERVCEAVAERGFALTEKQGIFWLDFLSPMIVLVFSR